MKGKLVYDYEKGRFMLGGEPLHCGQALEVRRNENWEQTRIECNNDGFWYLVGLHLKDTQLDNLDARIGQRE